MTDTTAPPKEAEATTLAEALVAAQAEMPAVDRDGTNPHFGSTFVTLGNLLNNVRPVLNKHGVGVIQYPSRDENGPTLVTILMHKSGERLESEAPLLLPKQDPQGQGSAITYMRRYALASTLGISDQEDDDGNAAGAKGASEEPPKQVPASPKQIDFLMSLVGQQKISADNLKLVESWAPEHLTGGKGGTCSLAIEALKEGPQEKADKTIAAMVKKAGEWAAKQTDLPVDES